MEGQLSFGCSTQFRRSAPAGTPDPERDQTSDHTPPALPTGEREHRGPPRRRADPDPRTAPRG
eukprot:6360411-Alexandrium_andersonii.AAC.1